MGLYVWPLRAIHTSHLVIKAYRRIPYDTKVLTGKFLQMVDSPFKDFSCSMKPASLSKSMTNPSLKYSFIGFASLWYFRVCKIVLLI